MIDLRAADEDRGFDQAAVAEQLGLHYLRLPIADASALGDDNARSLHQLLAQASGPVLVHCASGNRAGALLALMHARLEAANLEQALEFGRRAGMTSLEPATRALLEQHIDE